MKTTRLVVLSLLSLTLALARAQDAGVPAWQDANIGAAGSFQVDSSGVFTVADTGRGIWAKVDSFHFVFQPLNGDGQMVARVLGIQGGPNGIAKAGVMVREALTNDSRNALIYVNSSGDAGFQWRALTRNLSDRANASCKVTAPYWVKIVRSGDWIGGYRSPDGINWTMEDWQTISNLASQVYVGLAVTGGNSKGEMIAATFDQVNMHF